MQMLMEIRKYLLNETLKTVVSRYFVQSDYLVESIARSLPDKVGCR